MAPRPLALAALALPFAALVVTLAPQGCALPPIPDAGPPFSNDVPLGATDGGTTGNGFSCEAVCGHESFLCPGVDVPSCALACDAREGQSTRACVMAATDCTHLASCLADAGVGVPGDGG